MPKTSQNQNFCCEGDEVVDGDFCDLCLLLMAIYDFCVFFNGVEKNWKVEQQKLGKKLVRSESAKVLRRIPSSPSLFQGMKSSIKVIKKAVKL
jgi:hypothetical protein